MMQDDEPPANDLPTPQPYEVGYGKPPKETQFKKGQSGNRKGRGRKTDEVTDIRVEFEKVLDELVPVSQGAKSARKSRQEVILIAELQNALKGDPRAIEALFKRAQKCGFFTTAKQESGIIWTGPKGDDGKINRMFRLEQERMREESERAAAKRNHVSDRIVTSGPER